MSNDWLCTFEGELYEARPLSQPGHSKTSRPVNRASVEIPGPVHLDKTDAAEGNKKRSYAGLYGDGTPGSSKERNCQESCGNGTPSSSKKRSYEELFGDISDFLGTDLSGVAINR